MRGRVERHTGPNFFDGQHLYERLIPRITGSVREMVRVVETLRVGGGNDMAAGLHIDKFAKWCGDDPSRPAELLALIDEGFAEAKGYPESGRSYGRALERLKLGRQLHVRFWRESYEKTDGAGNHAV